MIANYHTHTWRCGHAFGDEREYVENAIVGGLKILGFSDHTPMPYEVGNKVIFGADAHRPEKVWNTEAIKEAGKIVEEYHLQLTDTLDFK